MADIFISYSRRDSEQALSLAERLRASGASVWMDTAALAAAETWSAEIVNAIENCSHFILLLSNDSVASSNVTKEVSLASEAKKTIVPIEIHRCELNAAMKYALAGLQKVSLSDEVALVRAFEKLGISSTDFQSVHPTPERTEVRPTALRIAVLPFEDQSPAHDNEWFSDGLTDELISTLNKLDALFVLDRKSSKMYKDAKMTVKQIAHELNVRYIVTGAVRKAGEKLRIQASLIEAASGATLWDEKFNGTMDDIFEIQEKTALDICEGLRLKLTPEEEEMLEEKMTNSPEAYEIYLQARDRANNFGDYNKAIELCEKAISLDPNYIVCYSSLSIYTSNLYRRDMTQTHLLARQKEIIQKIVELDPKSPYLYPPRANYYLNIGEKELALEMAKKAVEILPKRWGSWAVLAFIHSNLGNVEESIVAYDKAHEIDPTMVLNYYAKIINSFLLGDEEKIRIEWEKSHKLFALRVEEFPDAVHFRVEYMVVADIAGHSEISVPTARSILVDKEMTLDLHYEVSGIFARNGFTEEAVKHLRTAIDGGYTEFAELDRRWFINLKGTPEYDFLVEHIV